MPKGASAHRPKVDIAGLMPQQRTAVLVTYLEPRAAKALLAQLDTAEIQEIGRNIDALGEIDPAIVEGVVREFYCELSANCSPKGREEKVSPPAPEPPAPKARGRERARIRQTPPPPTAAPCVDQDEDEFLTDFQRFVRRAPPAFVAGVLEEEHLQVQAVALRRMGSAVADAVLAEMEPESRQQVVDRLRLTRRVPLRISYEIEDILLASVRNAMVKGPVVQPGRRNQSLSPIEMRRERTPEEVANRTPVESDVTSSIDLKEDETEVIENPPLAEVPVVEPEEANQSIEETIQCSPVEEGLENTTVEVVQRQTIEWTAELIDALIGPWDVDESEAPVDIAEVDSVEQSVVAVCEEEPEEKPEETEQEPSVEMSEDDPQHEVASDGPERGEFLASWDELPLFVESTQGADVSPLMFVVEESPVPSRDTPVEEALMTSDPVEVLIDESVSVIEAPPVTVEDEPVPVGVLTDEPEPVPVELMPAAALPSSVESLAASESEKQCGTARSWRRRPKKRLIGRKRSWRPRREVTERTDLTYRTQRPEKPNCRDLCLPEHVPRRGMRSSETSISAHSGIPPPERGCLADVHGRARSPVGFASVLLSLSGDVHSCVSRSGRGSKGTVG